MTCLFQIRNSKLLLNFNFNLLKVRICWNQFIPNYLEQPEVWMWRLKKGLHKACKHRWKNKSVILCLSEKNLPSCFQTHKCGRLLMKCRMGLGFLKIFLLRPENTPEWWENEHRKINMGYCLPLFSVLPHNATFLRVIGSLPLTLWFVRIFQADGKTVGEMDTLPFWVIKGKMKYYFI